MNTRQLRHGRVVAVSALASCVALRGLLAGHGAARASVQPSGISVTIPAVPAPRDVLVELASGMMDTDCWVVAFLVVLVCYRLCEAPKQMSPSEVVPFDKRPDSDRITYMNAYLALMSGMVNAIAFLEFGMTVSHHTGNTTHTGRTWGTTGMKFLSIIVAFMVGSGCVGANVVDTEAWIQKRYSGPLMSSAISVAAAMFIKTATGSTKVALLLLAFSQGILNAITRKCSAMPICVSHVTGYATDAGSILGTWVKAVCNNEQPPSLKKPFIFIASMITFALGGFIATKVCPWTGVTSLAIPAAGLALAATGFI